MSRIADVLAELGSLGAVKLAAPAKRTPVAAPEIENSEEEVSEDFDPVALLTEGFRDSPDFEAVGKNEGEEEERLKEEEADSEQESDETRTEDENGEDAEQDAAEDEAVDLSSVVSKLLQDVEAMSEQMSSLLRTVRELDALLK